MMAEAKASRLSTSLLFESADHNMAVVDIPGSISLVQGTLLSSDCPWIYSCEPLREPYPSTEPRTEKAKVNVRARSSPDPNDYQYRNLIRAAIVQARGSMAGEWCFQRYVTSPVSIVRVQSAEERSSVTGKTLKRKAADMPDSAQNRVVPRARTHAPYTARNKSNAFHPCVLSGKSNLVTLSMASVIDRPVQNLLDSTIILELADCNSRYRIPPGSVFVWNTICQAPRSMPGIDIRGLFRSALPGCTSTAGPGQFDAIVMDPPWSNRSVDRSRSYKATSGGRSTPEDPFTVLEGSLAEHIAPGAHVLCWITHKPRIRQAALQAFRTWGLELQEEWVWAKVTTQGDPVYNLDGNWRKPYEICLVGMKSEDGAVASGMDYEQTGDEQVEIKRRVICAVPDLHSRKPCLKELLQRLLPLHKDLRVLEIFARNLTAGWWAWGDEVLKYQSSQNWEDEQDNLSVAKDVAKDDRDM